jgi:hypothetical protein
MQSIVLDHIELLSRNKAANVNYASTKCGATVVKTSQYEMQGNDPSAILSVRTSYRFRISGAQGNHTIPYHTIPYHTIPYHTIPNLYLDHTIPYHTIPNLYLDHTIPYHTIPYYTKPNCTMRYHAILNCTHNRGMYRVNGL